MFIGQKIKRVQIGTVVNLIDLSKLGGPSEYPIIEYDAEKVIKEDDYEGN